MGKDTRRWSCNMKFTADNTTVMHKIDRLKDFDLCAANCETYCEKPILDGGPDPEVFKDCKTLASYYADGGRFTIDSHKYIIWEYDTCRVTQYNRLNHANQKISYCFDQHHWAGVVDYISSHCGNKSESHGGSCYFYDSLHFSTITLEKA
ncbi:hypothetical protein BDZ97DRAFT_1322210 [Flammula alnicola]|nr:hypothetical protein BDZ97DRAFT_1322210 [Flammula alnicola]